MPNIWPELNNLTESLANGLVPVHECTHRSVSSC